MTPTQPLVELRGFTAVDPRTNRVLLNNINLTVNPGEQLLLFGASGAGKSTLLDAIRGVIPQSVPLKISGECRGRPTGHPQNRGRTQPHRGQRTPGPTRQHHAATGRRRNRTHPRKPRHQPGRNWFACFTNSWPLWTPNTCCTTAPKTSRAAGSNASPPSQH